MDFNNFDGVNNESKLGNINLEQFPAVEKKRTGFQKHIQWLCTGEQGHTSYQLKQLLLNVEKVVFRFSIVGVGLYSEICRTENRTLDLQAFSSDASLAPQDDHVPIKTKTRAMNHAYEYAVENKRIWFKPIGSKKEEWKEIPFDRGKHKDLKPVGISVDGANLTVLDDKGQVHYKKVFAESWQSGDVYTMRDKNTRHNWKDRWFSLPFLHHIVVPFIGKSLTLPSECRGWAIAHRGQFNHFIQDAEKRKHHVSAGVTTLYTLDQAGKDIQMFDPWKPQNAIVKLRVPEATELSFEANQMSVAASTLMLFGDASEKVDGKWQKQPTIYTRLADIDALGWNPGLKYTYDHETTTKSKRILPTESWVRHSLPELTGDAEISERITILQTGEGNAAREMRIEGRNEKGKTGYWFKKVDEEEWHFHGDDLCCSGDDYKAVALQPAEIEPITPYAKNFDALDVPLSKGVKAEIHVADFHQYKTNSKVNITIEGHSYQFDLIRRDDVIAKILRPSYEKHSFHLVLPKEVRPDDLPKSLQAYFKGDRHLECRVNVSKDGQSLIIKSAPLTTVPFSFKLSAV